MGFGKDGNGVIIMENREQALGALANSAGILVGTKIALTEDFRMLKSRMAGVVRGLTAAEGTGLGLYLINGDLTLAEASAKITQTGPTNRGARVETEIAERFVRLVGMSDRPADPAGTETVIRDVDSNGPVCMPKPRWTFLKNTSWQWLVFNHGTTITTGASIEIFNEAFGLWLV